MKPWIVVYEICQPLLLMLEGTVHFFCRDRREIMLKTLLEMRGYRLRAIDNDLG